jgi:hypothetical protein
VEREGEQGHWFHFVVAEACPPSAHLRASRYGSRRSLFHCFGIEVRVVENAHPPEIHLWEDWKFNLTVGRNCEQMTGKREVI